jgi:IS30 family transposase
MRIDRILSIRGSSIGMRVGLAERAADIDSRTAFGHWQADGVIGVGCHLHTEVERRTRYLRAILIPDKTSAATLRAQYALFSGLPEQARASVTMDNGTEFSAHAALLESPGMLTYFADPHGSWQRGSNENRNGMIRRYRPKGTTIGMDMADEIQMIVDEINNKPMRILGYRTPAEAWTDELLALNQQQRRCTCI